jgi:dihydroorotate dehydrogenase
MLYRLVRALLFLLPAETAHHVAFVGLRALQWCAPLRALIAISTRSKDPALVTKALRLTLPSPVGLAAGFDKDARAFDALGALGFGLVEVGTITPRPQPGNPRPRLFRLPRDGALVNRMGFNNEGAVHAEKRLARPHHCAVGVNIGKGKPTPEPEAVADYVESTKRLARYADYLVVNVSSPNTPGLRNLQAVSSLRPLLVAVREELDRSVPDRRVPLLVKIAPDLADEDVDSVADLAIDLGLDGIIATNTTIRRDGLKTPAGVVEAIGAGGLSGAPLRERSLAVLRRLRARVGDCTLLVASGGILSAEDAWQRIRAGATLVQVYTGFIYGGPLFARDVAVGLARLAREAGFSKVQDAVGTETRG